MSLTGNLSFRRVYTLKAQTPILHFQYSQHGATLRATEVKPKLDRFIQSRAEDRIKPEWYIKEGESALNYKLRLEALGRRDVVNVGYRTDYDIYYGNMGDDAVFKKGIVSNITMTVLCTIPELSQIIDEFIAEFFAVTNFGTMQNKGFGSYIVEDKKDWYNVNNICEALKETSGAPVCYYFMPANESVTFKAIKQIYSIMKSGTRNQPSLLFSWMYKRYYNIENEKDYIKRKWFNSGNRKSNTNATSHHYVRALLGVCDHIGAGKTEVKIVSVDDNFDLSSNVVIPHDLPEMKDRPIQRLDSPVFFKVIDNRVYFIANLINDEIYGKRFVFYTNTGKNEILTVPSESKLGEDFVDAFIEYCVDELNGRSGNSLNKLIQTKNGARIFVS